MKELRGTKTEKNLQEAFAGESMARNKYTYYASKAKKDGYVQIAALFEETANNEKEHAKLWFKLLQGGGIKSTTDNLADAAAGVSDPQQLHSNLALSLARNAAIPVGQVLDNEEMERLVNELFACSNVNYTPDGRTVLCILPQSDIDKLLG